MPVKIGTFGPLSEAEFTELRQQKAHKTDATMTALLAEIGPWEALCQRSAGLPLPPRHASGKISHRLRNILIVGVIFLNW